MLVGYLVRERVDSLVGGKAVSSVGSSAGEKADEWAGEKGCDLAIQLAVKSADVMAALKVGA
jgi:hypothetical protein